MALLSYLEQLHRTLRTCFCPKSPAQTSPDVSVQEPVSPAPIL